MKIQRVILFPFLTGTPEPVYCRGQMARFEDAYLRWADFLSASANLSEITVLEMAWRIA
jgi:hypothetical protein